MSEIGGLLTSIMTGASLLISGYQHFVYDKSMLEKLYGEEVMTGEHINADPEFIGN